MDAKWSPILELALVLRLLNFSNLPIRLGFEVQNGLHHLTSKSPANFALHGA